MEAANFDIYPILAQGKGPKLHWFPGDVPAAELGVVLAAMANSEGGTVYLGIHPESGDIQGIYDLRASQDLIFKACLSLEPTLVLPLPRLIQVGETNILEMTIPDGMPHVYSLEGRYFWRQGRNSAPIPARDLRQLLVERGLIQFESRVPSNARFSDLDQGQLEAYVQGFLSAARLQDRADLPEVEEILLQRGCLQQQDGKLRPTYAGLLLFGDTPQRWLPAAHILAARFSGESFEDHFIKEEISGSLHMQLQQVERFLRSNLQSVVRMDGLTHQESLEYPFAVVRELVVNAIAHRDYNVQGDSIHINIFSNRLEVTSPGKLPGPMTLTNLLETRFSRNPVIVQVLSDLGYVEKLGYGLDRVVGLLRESSMPAPRFEEVARSFRVTIFNSLKQEVSPTKLHQAQQSELNLRQEAALEFLDSHKRITNREYQEICPHVHAETLRRDLADLVSRGILLKIGDKKSTYYILK